MSLREMSEQEENKKKGRQAPLSLIIKATKIKFHDGRPVQRASIMKWLRSTRAVTSLLVLDAFNERAHSSVTLRAVAK